MREPLPQLVSLRLDAAAGSVVPSTELHCSDVVVVL